METDAEYLEKMHAKDAIAHAAQVAKLASKDDQPEDEKSPEEQAVADAQAAVEEAQSAHIKALQDLDAARQKEAEAAKQAVDTALPDGTGKPITEEVQLPLGYKGAPTPLAKKQPSTGGEAQ